MLGGGGERWCPPAPFPRRSASVTPVPPGHTPKWVNCSLSQMPQEIFKLLLLHCVSIDYLSCYVLKGRGTRLCISAFFQIQAHWFSKFQALSPSGYKNSGNSVPLTFEAQCYGDSYSPCRSRGVGVYFFPLTMPSKSLAWLLPGDSPMSPFSSQPHLCHCYPL